ncbi:MAG: DNA gyrase subunit B [Chloroflexota bacterium]|nr:MAG: DNA gyrase subunit B [Chloroflexota bacterium]
MTTKTAYNASDIKDLDSVHPLEPIRRLPGMYIGNNSVYGLHHILMEVIDNSVDEIINGHGSAIRVKLHSDGSASVWDDGRGIPVEYKTDIKMSALTRTLTKLHSGAKFRENGKQDAYLSGSGGLHGVGIKATNALSKWLGVVVRRNGVIYRQRFENGGDQVTPVEIVADGQVIGEISAETELVIDPKTYLLTQLKVKGKTVTVKANPELGTGTELHFRPNRAWFDPNMDWPNPEKNVPWDFTRLETRLEQVAHLHPGVKIELRDERGPKKDHKKRVFHSKKGLLDYIAALNEGVTALHKPIQFKGGNKAITVEVVLQYAGDETNIYSFVNSIPTPLGGTAVSGFQAGLTKAINQFGADKKLLKDGSVKGEDLQLGLTAILNVTMSDTPQFSSQTKEALTTPEAQGVAMSVTYENLLAFLNKNIPVGKSIVGQAQAAARGREAAKAARQLIIRKSALEVSGLPGKLADVSRGAPIEQTMLFIVEGDSAGGSCKQGRDRRYHAILPMRGKILNTERGNPAKILANTEIKSIVAAIGAGIGTDFKVEEMRYGGVAITVDADVDGAHIRTLLYTLFWRHMKPLVLAGKLYIAVAPLYQLKKGKETRYAYSDEERNDLLQKWGKEGVTIQRYKGLGEMNPAQLRETIFAVNPVKEGENGSMVLNEHMVRVTVEDAHHTSQTMSVLMSNVVAPRKSWLLRVWAGEDAMNLGDNDCDAEAEE